MYVGLKRIQISQCWTERIQITLFWIKNNINKSMFD